MAVVWKTCYDVVEATSRKELVDKVNKMTEDHKGVVLGSLIIVPILKEQLLNAETTLRFFQSVSWTEEVPEMN